MEDLINNTDLNKDLGDVADAKSGWELYKFIQNNGSHLDADIPFSLLDLSSSTGRIAGANADIIVAGAQLYWISAGNYFKEVSIYNLDDGSIGAGIGALRGLWTVDKYFDMYSETGRIQDPKARPFRNLVSSPNWIRELPPAGYP